MNEDSVPETGFVNLQQILLEAISWHQKGDLERASSVYARVLELEPEHFDALHLLGVIAIQCGEPERAVELIGKAIRINPNSTAAYYNRAKALRDLRQFNASLNDYDNAIARDHNQADIHYNRGNVLREMRQYEAAVGSYEKAVALAPLYVEALNNLGDTLRELGRYTQALQCYDRVLALQPKYHFLHGMRLHTQMHVGEWHDLADGISQLEAEIECGEMTSPPFQILPMIGSADLQRKAAEIWADRKYPVTSGPLPVPEVQRHEKIRLGYFSADFHNHATTYLMAELVEKHDRKKFEVLAFSFGPDHKDEMRQRMSLAFDRFIDVESRSDIEIAQLSRSLGIDLAFDLKGYTRDSRPGIFAARAAPVQVSYLGYPGTTGSAFMDYLVADSTLIPESSRRFYSEKIIYLPRSYQPNDSRRAISMKRQVREEAGLPAAGFVYCCFNNTFKILPSVFDIWMRVLDSVNGSVLWLIADSAEASDRLRGEAVGRGVSADRLVFAERLPLPEHLARHQLADLFLDTFPCNAHTTASDALWAGLPVLTCPGETFASRVAASLLNAVDMPELIAASQQEYEDLAINLATQPERLAAIRNKLACQKPSSALFNTELYVNRFEAACSAIHERYQAGLPCEHILIE